MDVAELSARNTLPQAWARVWAERPDAPLVLDACEASPRWCGAAEFDDRTRRAAARLLAMGLRSGDRMVWSASASLDAVVANVGALRAGLVVVPANPLYTAREMAHVVDDVRPAAVVLDDPARAGALAGPMAVLDRHLESVTGGRVVRADTPDGTLDAAAPDVAALVGYTSGTTGAPKGAVLTHGNLLANSEAIARTWRWTCHDRLVHTLPVFHGHGLCVALYTSLLVGGSVVLLPRFDVHTVLDARAGHSATMFFGVPTMYHRLAASPRVSELAALRLAVSGSAALRADLHGALSAQGGVDVLERYGMTETLMTLSNPYDGERRPGTVGFPFPGVEARVDPAGPPGEGGELLVRGPAVFAGYWERPAATGAAFDGGWFRTGDLAEVDDGYVRLLGRSTEVIITGGYNVYPSEVEDVLLTHPGVVEAAVVGLASDEWGEVVCAWVVADGVSPPNADSILEHAAAGLAPYKRPRQVRFVDALPRNAMGKVRRSELR